jgi:hypothetical protein
MLKDGWTKGDFNKDGIGHVAELLNFMLLLLLLMMIHDGFL